MLTSRSCVHAVQRALVAIICLVPLLATVPPAKADLLWSFSSFAGASSSGRCSSLALDSNGIPHIVIEFGDDPDVRYAVQDGDSWNVQTIASAVGPGACAVSLALDQNDRPHVSFFDVKTRVLKYAELTDFGWSSETVDDQSDGGVGYDNSLALDAAGHPHISYYDGGNGDLRYAVKGDSGWQTQIVDGDNGDDVGWFTSIQVDLNGLPHIAYYDSTHLTVRYASLTTLPDQWEIQIVDTNVGFDPWISLALDANDVPHISYGEENARLIKYATLEANDWAPETIINNGFTSSMTSIAIDAAGRPHVAFYGPNTTPVHGTLSYAVKVGSSWLIQTVTDHNNSYMSLALDPQGGGHISFYDVTDDQFIYAEQGEDLTPPVTTATATANGASYTFGDWTNQSVTVTLDATDDGFGLAGTFYALDGGSQQTYDTPFEITTEGTHSLAYWSEDLAGNKETEHTDAVKIDRTKPVITYSGNLGSYTVDQTVDIHCEASDALSGVATTDCADITGPASSFAVGANAFSAVATDVAGNTGSASTSFTVEVTADGLCALTADYASNRLAGNLLCYPLRLAQFGERLHIPGFTRATTLMYTLLVETQRGRTLTPDEAETLIRLARSL